MHVEFIDFSAKTLRNSALVGISLYSGQVFRPTHLVCGRKLVLASLNRKFPDDL
jgi:hypothetical protein